VIDVRGIGEIARGLVKIIQAEKLVEGGTWEIYGRESAVDIQEAVSGSSHIGIEPVGKASVIDSNHLRLRGIGKILRSEIVWEGEDEPLVDVSAMITGDHFKIVDAEQLGERVAWEKDRLELNHGIDEAVRGVQRLKKSPKLFMETYHKSMAGLERRRSMINLQFMLEMRKLEEIDESYFNEEFNVWLSDEPLTNEEICRLMRGVERERKLEGKPPLVQFLPRGKRTKKAPKKPKESTPPAK
jgi:hypothetical protein